MLLAALLSLQTQIQPQATFRTKRDNGNWVYFVHGTTEDLWGTATSIRVRGVGDFGLGFYTFEDTRFGRKAAAEWAQRKAGRTGTALLVRVKMMSEAYRSLDREEVSDATLDTAYQLYYPSGLIGKELVVGPVGRNGPDGQRLPRKDLPLQFKFEGNGIAKLVFDSIMPAP